MLYVVQSGLQMHIFPLEIVHPRNECEYLRIVLTKKTGSVRLSWRISENTKQSIHAGVDSHGLIGTVGEAGADTPPRDTDGVLIGGNSSRFGRTGRS